MARLGQPDALLFFKFQNSESVRVTDPAIDNGYEATRVYACLTIMEVLSDLLRLGDEIC